MPFYTPPPPNVSCNLYIVYVVFLILLFWNLSPSCTFVFLLANFTVQATGQWQ